LLGIELELCGDGGQIAHEGLKNPSDLFSAPQFAVRDIGEPVARLTGGSHGVAAMFVNVHAREIGDKTLIPVLFKVQDKDTFGLLLFSAKALCAKEQAQFEGHVKSGQRRDCVRFGPREIVNTVATLFDQRINLIDARLATIV
jgi:hypothetical protein